VISPPKTITPRGAAARRSLPAGAVALSIAAVALTGTAAAAPPSGPTFSVRPAGGAHAYVVAGARPGAVVRRSVLVVNSGDRAGAVRLYAVDAVTGATSGAVYRGEHAPRRDVGAWTALSADRRRLAAGASRLVRLTIHVPRGARPGEHLGAVVAENQTVRRGRPVRRGHGALKVDVRLLTVDAVQIDVAGQRSPHLSLTGAASGGSHGRQTVLLGVRNDGTELTRAHGRFSLADSAGHVLMRRPLRLDTLVPSTAIELPVPVTGRPLGTGSYRVSAELRYRGRVVRQTMPLSISSDTVKRVFRSRPDLAPPTPAGAGQAWLLGVGGLAAGLALAAGAAQLRRRRASR
jgi:hypothetical protein